MAEALGVGVAVWSPLGGGLLTGKYRTSSEGRLAEWNRLVHNEDEPFKAATVDAVISTAQRLGVTPAQIAVAWLLERARRSPTGIVPIIGPRTVEQLDSYLGGLAVALDDDTYDELEQVSRIDLGQPHNQLAGRSAATLGGEEFRLPPFRSA